jgi:hypothetical protein
LIDTLTEKDFQEALQNGEDGGTGVCMREGTTSRIMAAEFCDFYSVNPEYFGYPLVFKLFIKSRTIVAPAKCCKTTKM